MWRDEDGSVEVRSADAETSFAGKPADGLNMKNERKEQIRIASLT